MHKEIETMEKFKPVLISDIDLDDNSEVFETSSEEDEDKSSLESEKEDEFQKDEDKDKLKLPNEKP